MQERNQLVANGRIARLHPAQRGDHVGHLLGIKMGKARLCARFFQMVDAVGTKFVFQGLDSRGGSTARIGSILKIVVVTMMITTMITVACRLVEVFDYFAVAPASGKFVYCRREAIEGLINAQLGCLNQDRSGAVCWLALAFSQ